MSKTFIIAEAACTWLHAGLEGAYRSIRAAKECGADAWKTQFTSSPIEMGKRRWHNAQLQARFESPEQLAEKYERLNWDPAWLPKLKEECDRVGIEFMCTVFIPKDIPRIAPYVSRFKVSAFEGKDCGFIRAHHGYGKPVIRSVSDKSIPSNGDDGLSWIWKYGEWEDFRSLWCVSEYPTAIERLSLHGSMRSLLLSGLSDHTTSVLTGAVAVGAGARIIEKHVRLHDTPEDDPDYGHSLRLDATGRSVDGYYCKLGEFWDYVQNIREAERML